MAKPPSLDAAYGLKTPDDSRRLYADWADSYDAGFAEEMDYVLPQQVAQGFQRAGGQGPVLDLGAGTGLCGQALAALGFGAVDGTDISEEMLAVAARKQVYGRLFVGDLTDRLPVDDGAYAGAVSAGTFTHGHVGPSALSEVLRVLRPGGIAALSVRDAHWRAAGFQAALAALGPQLAGHSCETVPIYGPEADGAHAGDRAILLILRRG